MKVSVFARAMTIAGEEFPQGGLYPAGMFKPPKEEQLRRNRIIMDVDLAEVFDMLERGSAAPERVLDLIASLMDERENDLELLDRYLDRLTIAPVEEDDVEVKNNPVEVETEVVEVEVDEGDDEDEDDDEGDDEVEEAADETPEATEDNPEDEKDEPGTIRKLVQKFPFKE